MKTLNEHLNIADRHRAMVENVLRQHVPGMEVWAYGSRVNGRGHDGSDLDLVLLSTDSQPLKAGKMRAIEEAFRDSNIPFLVDVHDWSALPEQFQSEIKRNHVVLLPGVQ